MRHLIESSPRSSDVGTATIHCADENTEAQFRELGPQSPYQLVTGPEGVQVFSLLQWPFSGLVKYGEAGILFLEPINHQSPLKDWDGKFTECLPRVRQFLN